MPTTVYLKDYVPPPFKVVRVELFVDLHISATTIDSTLYVEKNTGDGPLELDGQGLDLLSIKIDGRLLDAAEWAYSQDKLVIQAPRQERFMLEIQQRCDPQSNTVLSGLYISSGTYCTQMEAEGFRRFAFMQDRPDVMATYLVHIYADKDFPVLLSNGNKLSSGHVASTDRHFAIWEDPHPKPTYLFALVAGNLAVVKDNFTTMEGRSVELGIYVEQGKQDRCAWAMTCLKASMRWDEERFERAYDLDVFNIVAVSDFNMGAMENKGLNIFNDKYILARPDTATDADYLNIERIIAHEYFHNWSGNRITCRDWFQLCLKEGLTVFRDQEFTSDLRSRAVKRIEDVKTLRARQFPEDQGPLAHAVRPDSYIEINNFYTPTIYEKGAEICGMLQTLLGVPTFRAALGLYFERHDGEAATVEDFLRCMSEASGRDLQHFSKWYEQAGTPIVDVATHFSASDKSYTVTLKQHTPATPGQDTKIPLHMPLGLALLNSEGVELPLLTEETIELSRGIFEFTSPQSTLTFRDVKDRPILSINRGFSAPIILRSDATDTDLLLQMARDTDSFNRWEAAQTCARRLFVDAYRGQRNDILKFAEGLSLTLTHPNLDQAFKALMLQMPSEADVTVALAHDVDATQVYTCRTEILQTIATALEDRLLNALKATTEQGPYKPDTAGCATRSLRSAALSLLSYAAPKMALQIAQRDFSTASNMTTKAGALTSVLSIDDVAVETMLTQFYDQHKTDPLLIDKWLALCAARATSAADVERLISHPAFTFKTPNRVYALLGGFTGGNLKGLHAADGSGYRLLGNSIITLNGINPQVAARMANGFRSWSRYDHARRTHASAEMHKILHHNCLSNDVFEIISRTLQG